MKDFFKNHKNQIFIVFFLGFVNLFIMLIYNTFLLSPDEYNYSHIAWTNITIDSIQKLIESLKSLYNNWTGRVPAMAIIQICLWKGIWIYEILNVIIFSAYVIFICKVTNSKINSFNITFIVFCSLLITKAFAEKFLWLSGSINYLWAVTLMLVVIKFYYDIVILKKELNTLKGVLFLLVSFFAGWSHENVVFYLGSFILILGIYKIKDFIKFDTKTKILIILNILFFGVGVILLIFSPGNFLRLNSGAKLGLRAKIEGIITNFEDIWELILLNIISMIIIFNSKKIIKSEDKIKFFKDEIIIFFFPLAIALMPMLVISEFPSRSMLVYETMILVITVYNFNIIIEKINLNKIVIIITIILSIGVFGKLTKDLYTANKYLGSYKKIVEEQIKIAKENKYRNAYLTRLDNEDIKNYNDMLINFSPSSSRNGVINMYMSTYYDFDSIVALKDDEYLVSIKLSEPLKDANNYKVINLKNKETLIENNDETETSIIEFVIKKEQLPNCKIDFAIEDIQTKIDKIELITNIDVEKRCMQIENVNYQDILFERNVN